MIFYHTQERRTKCLDKPIKCNKDNAWLGQAYYFWENEDDAVFCGSTDDKLTDQGWQQMVKALENKNDWDLIVSSKLQRCREFAELIASEDDIDIELDKSFDEIDFLLGKIDSSFHQYAQPGYLFYQRLDFFRKIPL